jgi:2-polyprenyl-3-methyl-5-hydroxy-6-metoxy-1,4-benzoquinol methylase
LKSAKYHDHKLGRRIDLQKDGCALNVWGAQYGRASFAWHPKGFPIFLSPRAMEKYDEYRKTDPYAVDLNASPFHQRRAACTLEMIETAVSSSHQESPKILDLGCGRGHLTARIREEFPHAELSALDASLSAIDYAAEHFPGIDFAVANAYAPPYSLSYFDIVVCNNLWEHVPDPMRLLRRVRAIMRPRGFLILSTPSRYRLINLLRVLLGRTVLFASNHHVTEYSVGQVIEQLRYGGFDVIQSYSKPLARERFRVTAARTMISFYLSLMGSHHNLEETVFYLGQKR